MLYERAFCDAHVMRHHDLPQTNSISRNAFRGAAPCAFAGSGSLNFLLCVR